MFVDSVLAYVKMAGIHVLGEQKIEFCLVALLSVEVCGFAVDERKSESLQTVFVIKYVSGRDFCFLVPDWTYMRFC